MYFFSEFATNRKRINYFLILLAQRIMPEMVFAYPIKLTVCPGNLCNLNCALCPVGQNAKGRKKGLMKFSTFKRIIDECGPYLYELDLYNWGEPLLNKDVFEMVRYAKKFKIKVRISSNLNHFNEEICSELIKSGVDHLIVSLDGTSQESVNKYQVGNDFLEVISNMKKLVRKKRELNSSKPFVRWRFLVTRYNEEEIDESKNLAKEIGVDKLEIAIFRCDMGSELLLNDKEQFENVQEWLSESETLSKYDYSNKAKKTQRADGCGWLWTQSTINWNGSVSPCCAVWHEKFDFGNINRDSFRKIWNNKKYQDARKISRGDNINMPDNICHICCSNKATL